MSNENLVCIPEKDLTDIYNFLLELPAKDVIEVLKKFANVRKAEIKDDNNA